MTSVPRRWLKGKAIATAALLVAVVVALVIR